MTFLSIEFVLFLVPVLLVFYLVNPGVKKWILLLASLIFMAMASPAFLIYALLFVGVNYWVGRAMKYPEVRFRKRVYYFGQVFNIGGLFLFKYLNFILSNFQMLVGVDLGDGWLVKVIVPLGISYYTFQGISYLYLIYKAGDQPARNLGDLALYMLFFPKLLAGPIERHRHFLSQISPANWVGKVEIAEGLKLILWGAFKKVMIGDTLGIIVNKVYGNVDGFEGIPLLVTFLIQPIQLYGDFSGYTDMAIGLAKLFGIQLSPNFNRPFFAQSVAQFWKRWHISLSSWCNDFIYNRLILKYRKKGDLAVIYAMFSAFMIIGIWHGANWTFIVVGALQVIALSYEFYTRKWRKKLFKNWNSNLTTWFSRMLVYLFVAFYHIFFFSSDLKAAFIFIGNMFSLGEKGAFSFGFNMPHLDFVLAILSVILVFLIEWREEVSKSLVNQFRCSPISLRWLLYLMGIIMVVHFSKNTFFFTYAEF